jgi:hypothetical protein
VCVEIEIRDKRELDSAYGVVTCAWRVLDQDARLLVRATVDVVWRRGEPAAEGESHEHCEALLL